MPRRGAWRSWTMRSFPWPATGRLCPRRTTTPRSSGACRLVLVMVMGRVPGQTWVHGAPEGQRLCRAAHGCNKASSRRTIRGARRVLWFLPATLLETSPRFRPQTRRAFLPPRSQEPGLLLQPLCSRRFLLRFLSAQAPKLRWRVSQPLRRFPATRLPLLPTAPFRAGPSSRPQDWKIRLLATVLRNQLRVGLLGTRRVSETQTRF
jgi:hypothetical protein